MTRLRKYKLVKGSYIVNNLSLIVMPRTKYNHTVALRCFMLSLIF